MEEIPRGHVPLLNSHPITHENTSPTHKPRRQRCVQRRGDIPDGVFTGAEDLATELKWKHWKRTSPFSTHQWHPFHFSWASSRKDDSTKMPILTFLGPPMQSVISNACYLKTWSHFVLLTSQEGLTRREALESVLKSITWCD